MVDHAVLKFRQADLVLERSMLSLAWQYHP